MPTLSSVWVWPPSGWAKKLWSHDGSVEEDAFARSSRSVSDAFSTEIAKRGIPARHSELRFMVLAPVGPDLVVSVVEKASGGFEVGHVRVPVGFSLLAPLTRRELAADALELATRKLGELRGWDDALIVDAMNAVRANDYEFVWFGPWKLSPDRRTRVQLTARLMDNGFGQIRALFAPRDGSDGEAGPAATVESEPIRGWTTMESFERAAKSLRWVGSDAIRFTSGGFKVTRGRVEPHVAEVNALTGRAVVTPKPGKPLEYPGDPSSAPATPRVVFQPRR